MVGDFAALLKSYRVSRVTGDRYAGEFPRELFRKHGIAYDLGKHTKSELFRDLLPLLNSGRIVLPHNDRLQGQIVGLERRTSAVGRDTISHPDRGHDDVANAVAGAAASAQVKSNSLEPGWVPTKMGGAGAPDDIDKAHRTQAWLATSDEPAATVSGRYFFHQRIRDADPTTMDVERQDLLLDMCRRVSGAALTAS